MKFHKRFEQIGYQAGQAEWQQHVAQLVIDKDDYDAYRNCVEKDKIGEGS